MANPLIAATVSDGYSAAATIQDVWNARGGWFTIATNAVLAQLQYGKQGLNYWTAEMPIPAGSDGTLPASCIGIRFRNAVAGSAATVSGNIFQGDEPVLSLSGGGANATPTGGYSVVGQGHKTGTNGVATVLGSALACAGVSVHANATNTGIVYLGKSTVTTGDGYELSPGDALAFAVGNVNLVYFDVAVNGEGVSWMAVG